MRLYALLALCVIGARAATIPIHLEAEKKIPEIKEDLDNVELDPEPVEQPNVKDVENSLRNKPADVPVKVIVEKFSLKNAVDSVHSNDYVPETDDNTNIKRAEIDLRNPGPPQRQEHDNQNPNPYGDRKNAIVALKDSITDTQNIFKEGFQKITEGFDNWFKKTEELTNIQQNVHHLRESFTSQISKINTTIQSYIKPDSEGPSVPDQKLKDVEDNLNNLDSNFKSGVAALNEGIELLAILKEEDDALEKNLNIQTKQNQDATLPASGSQPTNPQPTNPQPANPAPPNLAQNILQAMSNSINSGISNLQSAYDSMVSTIFNRPNNQQNQQNQQTVINVPGAQSDEATTARPPNIFEQVQQQLQQSWNNLVNPSQTQQTQQQSQNPITQVVNNIATFLRPPANNANPPAEPQGNSAAAIPPAAAVAAPPAAPAPAPVAAPQPEGTNVVPVVAPVAAPAKETEAVKPGPIRQLIQNNPIVKGITNTVQKLQGVFPDEPRETEVKNDEIKGYKPGINNAATGDNNDSSGVVKSEQAEEIKPEVKEEEPVKCLLHQTEKEEKVPESVPDKTE